MAIAGGEPSTAIPSDGVPGPALALTWVKDGRRWVACREAEPRAREINFWQVRVDPRTRRADGPLRRVTNWNGFTQLSDFDGLGGRKTSRLPALSGADRCLGRRNRSRRPADRVSFLYAEC